ncbi:MAG TPA: Flp pilus assembly protein CpaB [Microvirga sp.]|jgi:pilus assembly protein CpaB|nr:Flp pilus assembly protein CpaB [Microvirga sp.]
MLRIIILVVALGAGGLAAWIALTMQPQAVATAPAAVQPPPPAMVDIVVAAADINQGQAVGETNVRWQSWPESAVGPGLITRKKQPDALATLKGSVVRNAILSGEPVREEKLVRGVGLLAAMLPSGKRAVAIRINAEATAGGFVLPNDRVDVIQTVSRPGQDGGSIESMSRVLLGNIRVLAIDQKVEDPKGGAVAIGKTATLELDPAQVEIISASQAMGGLSLALRSIADGDEPQAVHQAAALVSVRILRAGRSEVVRVR